MPGDEVELEGLQHRGLQRGRLLPEHREHVPGGLPVPAPPHVVVQVVRASRSVGRHTTYTWIQHCERRPRSDAIAFRWAIWARSLPSSFCRSITKFMSHCEAEKRCPTGEEPAFITGTK